MATPNYVAGEVWTAAYANSIGMHLIKTQTIGSAVSSVNVTSAFSADYDVYYISISGGTQSTNAALKLKLGASTTGYYNSWNGSFYATGAANAGGENNAANATIGGGDSNISGMSAILIGPYLAKYTIYQWSATFVDTGINGAGRHHVATSYTDFTITPSSGTMTGGTIRVYGYRNSLT